MSNYTIGEWFDRPNYECSLCAYSTLDQSLMEYHQGTAHLVFPDPIEPRATGRVVAPFTSPVLVGETGPEQISPTNEETK